MYETNHKRLLRGYHPKLLILCWKRLVAPILKRKTAMVFLDGLPADMESDRILIHNDRARKPINHVYTTTSAPRPVRASLQPPWFMSSFLVFNPTLGTKILETPISYTWFSSCSPNPPPHPPPLFFGVFKTRQNPGHVARLCRNKAFTTKGSLEDQMFLLWTCPPHFFHKH